MASARAPLGVFKARGLIDKKGHNSMNLITIVIRFESERDITGIP